LNNLIEFINIRIIIRRAVGNVNQSVQYILIQAGKSEVRNVGKVNQITKHIYSNHTGKLEESDEPVLNLDDSGLLKISILT
jgi:hypothetical protein